MTINKVTDFFVPELLAEALTTGFAGMQALNGTGAAIINTSMPAGKSQVGTSVKVPYFTNIGEFADLTNDGDALTPETITSSTQQATVKHSGKAIELTRWAELAAFGDPYQIAAAQIIEAAQRRIDKALIDTATDSTGWSGFTNDISAVGSGLMTYDAVVDTKMLWADELDNISLLVVHNKVFGDMLKLKDSTGRPLVTDVNENGLAKFVGIPVKVSNRVPTSGSGLSTVYTSIVCKRGSLVAWVNGNPTVMQLPDPLTASDITATHIFYCTHRYNPMNGLTKPGVMLLKTKAST